MSDERGAIRHRAIVRLARTRRGNRCGLCPDRGRSLSTTPASWFCGVRLQALCLRAFMRPSSTFEDGLLPKFASLDSGSEVISLARFRRLKSKTSRRPGIRRHRRTRIVVRRHGRRARALRKLNMSSFAFFGWPFRCVDISELAVSQLCIDAILHLLGTLLQRSIIPVVEPDLGQRDQAFRIDRYALGDLVQQTQCALTFPFIGSLYFAFNTNWGTLKRFPGTV